MTKKLATHPLRLMLKKSLQKPLKKVLAASMSAAILMSVPAYANNPAPSLKVDAPNRYEVKKGDTLWGISGRYLHSPWQWRKIWAANKQVKNPHLIYPGDILLMCVIKGETLVGIDTGEGCAGIERNMVTETGANTNDNSSTAATTQSVTITSVNNSIPPIPLSLIENWLDRTLIVDAENFAETPYILASKKGNLITGAGDTVYARGVPLIAGQIYGIYREGEHYVDPATNKSIGLEVTEVAKGRVTNVTNDGISSIELLKSYGHEVREGDRVFVDMTDNLAPVFYPKPADVNRGGKIVRVMGTIGSAANGSVVAINLGTENGATEGDVLAVYQSGALVRDIHDNDVGVRLPNELSGHLMVFKTFDKISYAYVLDAELPLNVGDKLLPPTD